MPLCTLLIIFCQQPTFPVRGYFGAGSEKSLEIIAKLKAALNTSIMILDSVKHSVAGEFENVTAA